MSELDELSERLLVATGPDREIDALLGYYADYRVESMGVTFRTFCEMHELEWPAIAESCNSYTSILRTGLPRFSESIDAALDLAEHLLPDHRFAIYTDGGGKGPCCLSLYESEPVKAESHAQTIPLAILKALITTISKANTETTK